MFNRSHQGSRPDGLEVWEEFLLRQPAPHGSSFYSHPCPHHPGHGWRLQRSLQDGPVAGSGSRALITAYYACDTFNTVAYNINYYNGDEDIHTQKFQMEFLECLSRAPARYGSLKSATTLWLSGPVSILVWPWFSLVMHFRTWMISDHRIPDL